MEITGTVMGMVVLSAGIFGIVLFLKSYRRMELLVNQQTQLLQAELLNLSRQMNEQLSSNSNLVQNYARQMGELQHRLGQLQESTQSMIHIGKDISSLQDILKAPKLRGLLGELFLEELLRQILPHDRYVLQYSFLSGEKVDAVILLCQGMVPVDAKFPLENFKRLITGSEEEMRRSRKQFRNDVKKHIDQIATKYILPAEGTFDFALMYLPAENIYYETIIKDDGAATDETLSHYAISRKVIPVSPNSFYAYLQAIVLGLRGLRIETSAREILANLAQLANDFRKFYEDFWKIGFHLSDAKTAFDKAEKRLGRLEHQLDTIDSQEAKTALPSPTTSGV